MVKITKRTDYGLTLVAALAQDPEKMQSLKSISDKYHMPYKFIGQVAAALLDAGLLTSKEGATGGYRLSKAANKISLHEIITVLDGPVVKVDCLRGKACLREGYCSHKQVLSAVSDALTESLTHKTVADLVS
jgi:Rrf2 family protein